MSTSAEYLGDHMGDVPALVIGCSTGPDRDSAVAGASIQPAPLPDAEEVIHWNEW
jgi:hypothetical protein